MPTEQLSEVEIMQKANLTVRQSEVWYNIRINGWTNGEAARILECSVGAIDMALHRADKKIQKTRELLNTERGERERTDISADKDSKPGFGSDYSNAPLAAVCHGDIRAYLQAELKQWEHDPGIIFKKDLEKAA